MNTYEIIPIPAFKDNYIWAMINHEVRSAIIVDPGDALPVEAFLKAQKFTLTDILITHHHWDHTNGVLELKKQFGVPVYGPTNDKVEGVTQPLRENDEVVFPDFPTFRVLDIPGHTKGHIAYYSPGILLCGDTLFSAGCGRLFEGTPEQMLHSLLKMATLPDDTKVYCAHEYTANNLRFAQTVEPSNPFIQKRIMEVQEIRNQSNPSLPSTIQIEKATNPFLRCDSPEIIEHVSRYAKQKLNNALEVFTQLRKWKDEF